ncbi:MAG: flavodoxin-dependent (E)-4-hydroxy-3-methylbut-2-enyl-diphosphate synthase [Oscillospiraceae bacterium]|nr:flavodoxin-dependent (E)-4-hydroxy-3-methylbut-2-enyl-diphosphate synthase [Oscillospiraceae bacterium]
MSADKKRVTRQIAAGGTGRAARVLIGGGAPVTVQSMCDTDTRDAKATLAQIEKLYEAGCQIIRVAVPDAGAAEALGRICAQSPLPVVADIHFDFRLALASLKAGVSKIRINPGNIGEASRVKAVADACKERNVPIRIGVNSGSVSREKLAKMPLEDAMAQSALEQLGQLEALGFQDVCLSVKAPSVKQTLAVYRRVAALTDAPLHLGVTETGTSFMGIVKSAVGIGALLCEGLGDTLRVSLTADPVEEVRAGIAILKACGLRREGLELISCPTCGRCRIRVGEIANAVERALDGVKTPVTVAVMGCAVNGPGEARAADIGLAGGDGKGVIFKKGEIVEAVSEEHMLARLLAHIKDFIKQTEVATSHG